VISVPPPALGGLELLAQDIGVVERRARSARMLRHRRHLARLLEGEILGADPPVRGEQHSPFDRVPELSDVARPAVAPQELARLPGDLDRAREPALAAGVGDEEAHRLVDLVDAFAQRRDRERDPVQAEEQVLAEQAARHRGVEIAICRGDVAHVDRPRLEPTHAQDARSSRTRKSFTWTAGERSPTSSRNTVPPSAISRRPGLALTAPVNAPRSCPNSSLSRSHSDRAAQFSRKNGRSLRGDSRWTVSASTSLPNPSHPG
jgi:hypothetical protein